MNWLDIVIVLLVTLPTFFGFRKGFLRKLLGIAGIIVGFILAINFYVPVAGILSKVIKENPVFLNVLSFLIIIGVVYGASIWVARFIANMNSGTSIIDKIEGRVPILDNVTAAVDLPTIVKISQKFAVMDCS